MLADTVIAGDVAVVTRAGSPVTTWTGLFSAKDIVEPTNDGYKVVGRDVTFVIRDALVGSVQREDVATINAVAYRVRDLGVGVGTGIRTITLAES